jgi:hypothetical protein
MTIVLMLILWLPLSCDAHCVFEHDIVLELSEETPVFFGANSEEFEIFIDLLECGILPYEEAKEFKFPYLTTEQVCRLHSLAEDSGFYALEDYDLSE